MASRRILSPRRLHRDEHEPPADGVVACYNKRRTCEQWIKEGKGAIKWTRLSCRTFAANAVRLQLHALAYNLLASSPRVSLATRPERREYSRQFGSHPANPG